MVIDMQYFGKPNFHKQHTAGLKKTIASLEIRISEHKQKIVSPESFYPDWESFDERQKAGFRRHWEKEIVNFKSQLKEARNELATRGEDDE